MAGRAGQAALRWVAGWAGPAACARPVSYTLNPGGELLAGLA